MISSFDEIITSSGALIFYALAEEAKKNIKVILTGTGGDEIAGVITGKANSNTFQTFF